MNDRSEKKKRATAFPMHRKLISGQLDQTDQSLVLLVSTHLESHTMSLQEEVGNDGGYLLLHLIYLK